MCLVRSSLSLQERAAGGLLPAPQRRGQTGPYPRPSKRYTTTREVPRACTDPFSSLVSAAGRPSVLAGPSPRGDSETSYGDACPGPGALLSSPFGPNREPQNREHHAIQPRRDRAPSGSASGRLVRPSRPRPRSKSCARSRSTTFSTCSPTPLERVCTSDTRKGYTATDVVARFKRMTGHHVLHPMVGTPSGCPPNGQRCAKDIHPGDHHQSATSTTSGARSSDSASAYDWDREDQHRFPWITTAGPSGSS